MSPLKAANRRLMVIILWRGALSFDAIPEKLPRYPILVVHLGRLAVDETAKGQKPGKALLADALTRAVTVADRLEIYAVEMFAFNESARESYLKFDFAELSDDRRHVYLTIKKIRKLVIVK